MLIEQAIFSSARTARADGYQIVAASAGVSAEDVRALTAGCPSHDSLCASAAESVSFFALPSGARCVAWTKAAGEEHSLRRGPCVATRCLLVQDADFARFQFNPFALLMAAQASGRLDDFLSEGKLLEAFALGGRSALVDSSALAAIAPDDRNRLLAGTLDGLATGKNVVVAGASEPGRFVAAVFNCLPMTARRELTFSTALRRSRRRPFRLVVLDSVPADERRRIEREGSVLVGAHGASCAGSSSWGRFVAALLAEQRFDEVVELVTATENASSAKDEQHLTGEVTVSQAKDPADGQTAQGGASRRRLRGDGSHPFDVSVLAQEVLPDTERDPSVVLTEDRPAAAAALQALDDVVFEAIAGRTGALDELRGIWPVALAQLGTELMERCREQYLRHAIRLWRECSDGEGSDQARLAVSATEVIELLSRDFPQNPG